MSNDEMRTAVLNHRLDVFARTYQEVIVRYREGQTFAIGQAPDAHVEAAYRELVASEAVTA